MGAMQDLSFIFVLRISGKWPNHNHSPDLDLGMGNTFLKTLGQKKFWVKNNFDPKISNKMFWVKQNSGQRKYNPKKKF